jgi:hypothetical protein
MLIFDLFNIPLKMRPNHVWEVHVRALRGKLILEPEFYAMHGWPPGELEKFKEKTT